MIDVSVLKPNTVELKPHKYYVVDSTGLVHFVSSFSSLLSMNNKERTNTNNRKQDTGNNKGETNMNDNDNVTFKDLKIVEERLNSKIDISNAKLSGKIDTSEAKLSGKIDASEASLSGKIDTLTAKIDSQSKLLYWIMGIISAGIVVPLITMLIKYLISK